MTSASLSRRLALLALLASAALLGSCGKGGSGGGTSTVRAINLTNDLPSVDLYIGGNKQFSALAAGTLANYNTLDANTYSVNVNSAGNTAALSTSTYTLSKDAHTTAVVWGSSAAPTVSALPEDYDTTLIGSGNTRVRMLNATTETGPVDVYFTASGTALSDTVATQSSVPPGTAGLTGFHEIPAGTYRLRVTGVNRPDDLRLDIPSVTLTAGQYATLVLTPGSGGVLVSGTLIAQQSTAVPLANTRARVRLVASVDSGGVVAATVGSTSLSAGLVSPAIQGAYTLVDAGSAVNLSVSVGGNPVFTGPQALVAGADYTLLAWGSTASPQLTVSSDDNRLPISSTRTKLRVINGVANLGPVTLLVDSAAYGAVSSVPSGTVSAYSQVTSNTGAVLEVTSGQGSVYSTTRTNGDVLAGQGVYTLFILSGKATPTGTLRNERP